MGFPDEAGRPHSSYSPPQSRHAHHPEALAKQISEAWAFDLALHTGSTVIAAAADSGSNIREPFDHGIFTLVEEPANAPWPAGDSRRFESSSILWRRPPTHFAILPLD